MFKSTWLVSHLCIKLCWYKKSYVNKFHRFIWKAMMFLHAIFVFIYQENFLYFEHKRKRIGILKFV